MSINPFSEFAQWVVLATSVLFLGPAALAQEMPRLAPNPDAPEQVRTCAEILAEPSEASESAQTRIQSLDREGNTLGAARAEARWLWSLRTAGRFEAAQCLVDALFERAAVSEEPEVLDRARYGQARLWKQQGQRLGDGYLLLASIDSPAFLEGNGPEQRNLASLQSSISYELGRYDESQTFREKQLRLAEQTDGSQHALANAHFNLAVLALARALSDTEARHRVRELFDRAGDAAQDAEEARTRRLEGRARNLSALLDDGAGAIERLERCFEIATALEDSNLEGSCLAALAVRRLPWDRESARHLLDRALTTLRGGESMRRTELDPWPLAHLWPERLHIDWNTLSDDLAFERSLDLLETIEHLRSAQPWGGDRARLMSVWGEPYRRLAGYLLERATRTPERDDPRWTEAAFAVLERMRGRALEEALVSSSTQATYPSATETSLQEILRQRTALQRRLLGPEPMDRAPLLRQLADLERRAEQLERQRTVAEPTPATGAVDLQEIEALLAPNEALLSFQIAAQEDIYGFPAGRSWVTVSSPRGSSVHPLPGADRHLLENTVPTLLGILEQHAEGRRERAGRARHLDPNLTVLAERVLGDVVDHLPPQVDHLVLVPDGVLHRVPFAALRLGVDGPPLASRFALSVVPSAALWTRWRSLPRSDSKRIPALILADSPAPSETAGPRRVRRGEVVAATRQWELERRVELPPLPGARHEGEAIRNHLMGGTELWIGDQVDEARLKGIPPATFEILHFATHALIDDLRPHRSAIWLSPGNAREDGLLQSWEIAMLRRPAQVVVLSTCNSATGLLLPNEGALSLSRPFFQSGARVVVGSLWQLPDAATAALFERFYDHLAEGASVAQALALAQRDRIEVGADTSDWAGLTVLGDGAFVPFPGGLPSGSPPGSPTGGSHRGVWIVLGVALALVFYRILEGRRRQLTGRPQGPDPPDEDRAGG